MSAIEALPLELTRRRVLSTKDAARFCGLSVQTFRRMRSRNAIPSPILLSERRHGYRIGDLSDWLDARAAGLDWLAYLSARAGNDNRQQP